MRKMSIEPVKLKVKRIKFEQNELTAN